MIDKNPWRHVLILATSSAHCIGNRAGPPYAWLQAGRHGLGSWSYTLGWELDWI
jgi:hypothetical protein